MTYRPRRRVEPFIFWATVAIVLLVIYAAFASGALTAAIFSIAGMHHAN